MTDILLLLILIVLLADFLRTSARAKQWTGIVAREWRHRRKRR